MVGACVVAGVSVSKSRTFSHIQSRALFTLTLLNVHAVPFPHFREGNVEQSHLTAMKAEVNESESNSMSLQKSNAPANPMMLPTYPHAHTVVVISWFIPRDKTPAVPFVSTPNTNHASHHNHYTSSPQPLAFHLSL